MVATKSIKTHMYEIDMNLLEKKMQSVLKFSQKPFNSLEPEGFFNQKWFCNRFILFGSKSWHKNLMIIKRTIFFICYTEC